MKKITKVFLGLMLYVSLLGMSTASANQYYVDASRGNDAANGSSNAPFATIQKAADIVKPGDTVIIRPGVYYENVVLTTTV